jgi:hypothetical protein
MRSENKPRLRLDPSDEGMHPLEAASNFNESMYFNVFDPKARLGGWFRLGNRANEGHAELTVCIYDADGTVYFQYQRPKITDNDAFDAGGMRFTVVAPFERLDVSYTGRVAELRDPSLMADPKRAFAQSPSHACDVSIRFTGLSPMFGGEPETEDGMPWMENAGDASGFARGHYEQHVRGEGTIRIGERVLEVRGFGLRDHSWGPRYWQSPLWYRWLTINFGDDLGAMVTVLTGRDGSQKRHGTFFHHGRYDAIVDAGLVSRYDAGGSHRALSCWVLTEHGERFDMTGEVLAAIPLRNRRASEDGTLHTTRITEAFTRFTLGDRVGYGMSEYLDQLIDGVPAGNAADTDHGDVTP